jgi:hypothetical protein
VAEKLRVLENKATDLIDNKGSDFAGIRNKATVVGMRRKAVVVPDSGKVQKSSRREAESSRQT